jgi:cytochrome c553
VSDDEARARPPRTDQPGSDARDDMAAWAASLSAEDVMTGIAQALRSRDLEAVAVLLKLLAVKDPAAAEQVYQVVLAVAEAAR